MKPFLANGTLVEDYEPLLKYWEKEKNKYGENKAIPSGRDLTYIEKVIEEQRVSLLELINILKQRFEPLIDSKIAKEVLEDKGFEVDENYARLKIAELLAKYCIEACKSLGIIKLKEPWKTSA